MAENLEKIGHYQILKSLGKGGMGEVFLAYDPLCRRQVALKQIRPELKEHPVMKGRFLREARVAAQLTHPSIIPIFSIDPTYYTMPYVEGETLKQILKQSFEEEKEGEVLHPIGSSILALTRIFLSVCEAIAYTHSKGIVHRDIKPDNIIVGKYGEVLLLDWGLADFIGKAEILHKQPQESALCQGGALNLNQAEPAPKQPNLNKLGDTGGFKFSGCRRRQNPISEVVCVYAEAADEDADYKDLTHPGKVPGTLNYIAPERGRGESSKASTDIYSLGVILYQLLTLRVPFHRTSLSEFRRTMHLEKLIDPLERAPYRDVPQQLADIAKRCLCSAPEERLQSVDEIIEELKSFLEGKPEWSPVAELRVDDKKDWEFQENILLAKHTAITRSPEIMEWVSLMISQASFSGNIKVETRIKMGKECQGASLLMGIPEAIERKGLSTGYCLWLGNECRLFHNDVEVMTIPESGINDETWHTICLEKIDNHLFLFIDHKRVCHYLSHIPMAGTHLGLLCRDADFEIAPLNVSVGSQNVMVNCLAVPDAFLANKNYTKALLEYRRIARSFSGRAEGREALFRAGITLLEETATHKKKEEREQFYLLALEEFGKLRYTPGAPLEYLGKSLVYKATKEIEEEIKCLELCLRKYPKHPLLRLIREHITFRLHETASRERISAFHFALLALRHLPQIFRSQDHARLLFSLKKHLEKLPFFLLAEAEDDHLACQLAFWLLKPITLVEMIETSSCPGIVANAMYGLLAMGKHEWVKENLHYLREGKEIPLIQYALLYFQKGPKMALEALIKHVSSSPTNQEMRCALFLFDRALLDGKSAEILPYFEAFPRTATLDALHIAACLLQNKWTKAQELLENYSTEHLSDEYSSLFIPMGCYLSHVEGKQIAQSHFGGAIDLPHPPTTILLSDYLRGKIGEKKGWMKQAFAWEKIALFRQLVLYHHCARELKKKDECAKRLKKELKKLSL